MGSSHSHDAPITDPVRKRRARVTLLALLIPLAAATLAGLILLWPGPGSERVSLGQPYSSQDGVQLISATVTRVDTGQEACTETSSADASGACVVPYVWPAGAAAEVPVDISPELRDQHPPKVGDALRLVYFAASGTGDAASATMIDYDRSVPLGLLAALYALVVILVARWRGVRAILGLGFAFLIMGLFMFPALVAGKPALWVALVGSVAIMFVVLYFAHGFTARTSTALLGTVFGLAVTAGLAIWVTDAAGLIGLGDESTYALNSQVPQLSLSALVICGLMVAGLGVLNDVTITQASAVWELAESSPEASARELFGRAMRIGRDHIASTVYTIAFAYAGGAFATLLLLSLYDHSFTEFLTTGALAEEVVRTLVGSIGLVLAIPVTTAIAVAVVKAVGPGNVGAHPHDDAGWPRGGELASVTSPTSGSARATAGVAAVPARGRRAARAGDPAPSGGEGPSPSGGEAHVAASPTAATPPAGSGRRRAQPAPGTPGFDDDEPLPSLHEVVRSRPRDPQG
ncbi:MAG: YibE/F family protein [Arthrobacter sp.]|jgi:uncharacterized membrane protein|nr:YibE/F family protein [Arthrobacter sp.]